MYIQPRHQDYSPDFADFRWIAQPGINWLHVTLVQLGAILISILECLRERLRLYTPTLSKSSEIIYLIFERPSEWPVQGFFAVQTFFHNHPHIVQITSLSIFFGPVVLLFPALLLHEIVVSVLHNLSFFAHGLIQVDECFWFLRASLEDSRESLFSYVDASGARYNKLTTDYWPFVAVRLLALCIGGVALVENWNKQDVL